MKGMGMVENRAAEAKVTKALQEAASFPDSAVVFSEIISGAATVFSQTAPAVGCSTSLPETAS